jgi:type IV pilus assembly protein PilV
MKSIRHPIKLSANSGVSLIEVLVTTVILSVGLLGLAGMHLQGLKNNQSAYFRSQATILAYAALDKIRANRSAAIDGQYNIEIGGTKAAGGGEATTATQDLDSWKKALGAALPSGDGSIACNDGTSICKVTVQWDDRVGQGGKTAQQFTVVTKISTL